jgi:hypothetical protein
VRWNVSELREDGVCGLSRWCALEHAARLVCGQGRSAGLAGCWLGGCESTRRLGLNEGCDERRTRDAGGGKVGLWARWLCGVGWWG